MIRYQDIFVPGGFPSHTYNPRAELKLEQTLSEAKENLCKLVTITGQTKSGKTVLTRKVFPPEESIWIDGGTVAEENDFWDQIVQDLQLFQTTGTDASEEAQKATETTTSVSGNIAVAKAETKVSASDSTREGSAQSMSRTVSSRIAALSGLRESKFGLIIDDFHYLPKDLQANIVRALKPLIFDGLPVIIIAIPHRRYDAVKVEKEMTGRILPISIPVWSNEELKFIPHTGFSLLKYEIPEPIRTRLSHQALGSPHLMQDFCRAICRKRNLQEASSLSSITFSDAELDIAFRELADTIGRPIFEKLARGPRQRTDRLPRKLKDGTTVDIYRLVLHALAHIKPGLVSLEYEDLRTAIRAVSESQIPQLQEVARVLKHMATIASSDQASTPVIDFEEADKKLHITDPFFAFYLRWGELS